MPTRDAMTGASERDGKEVLDLYAGIRAARARMIGLDGKTVALPANLRTFLGQLLAELKSGKSVTILETNAELTTMQAARMLSVSRQFLVQLLEGDQIPFHMVGTHRRVYARDLLAFKAKRDAARRKALGELVRAEFEEGLYDLVPINGSQPG